MFVTAILQQIKFKVKQINELDENLNDKDIEEILEIRRR